LINWNDIAANSAVRFSPSSIIAFVVGAGTAAVATVASLFVVEFNPQSEWSPRIGWLQSYNGAGQTVGLFWLLSFPVIICSIQVYGSVRLCLCLLFNRTSRSPGQKAEGHKEISFTL